jgi:hypothetical protein
MSQRPFLMVPAMDPYCHPTLYVDLVDVLARNTAFAGAESCARLSLANPFRLTRGDSVRSFDVSGILVGPEPDNPAGLGARFTRTAYDVAVGQLGFPQNHDIPVSQTTAPFRASVGNYRVGQG